MNNNNDYAIVAEGLTKQFGDFIATNHITFQVHPRSQRCWQNHRHAHALRIEPSYGWARYRGWLRCLSGGRDGEEEHRLHEPEVLPLR